MQVLVYHDLLGMMQHPHHAKVFLATFGTIFLYFETCARRRIVFQESLYANMISPSK